MRGHCRSQLSPSTDWIPGSGLRAAQLYPLGQLNGPFLFGVVCVCVFSLPGAPGNGSVAGHTEHRKIIVYKHSPGCF